MTEPTPEHKPGCPATGGYGHGKEACACQPDPTPEQDLKDYYLEKLAERDARIAEREREVTVLNENRLRARRRIALLDDIIDDILVAWEDLDIPVNTPLYRALERALKEAKNKC